MFCFFRFELVIKRSEGTEVEILPKAGMEAQKGESFVSCRMAISLTSE